MYDREAANYINGAESHNAPRPNQGRRSTVYFFIETCKGEAEMIISIPLSCPKCGSKLKAVRYDVLLNILKKRSWHICTACDFEREAEDFKRELLTV